MKIVVLAGGISTERTVSLVSGTCVCRALRRKGYQAILVDMFMGLENAPADLSTLFDAPDGLCPDVKIAVEAPDLEAVRRGRPDKVQPTWPSRTGYLPLGGYRLFGTSRAGRGGRAAFRPHWTCWAYHIRVLGT